MWEAIENILVNDAAWSYEKDYWDRGFLWDDERDEEEEFERDYEFEEDE